jgi:hypothetical protein
MDLLLELIDRVRSWLELRKRYESEQRANLTEVVIAITKATSKTRAYLGIARDNKILEEVEVRLSSKARRRRRTLDIERDRESKAEISNLWVEVGRCLLRLNEPEASALANRCLLKSDYWADPHRWTPEMLQNGEIGLEHLQTLVLDLAMHREA